MSVAFNGFGFSDWYEEVDNVTVHLTSVVCSQVSRLRKSTSGTIYLKRETWEQTTDVKWGFFGAYGLVFCHFVSKVMRYWPWMEVPSASVLKLDSVNCGMSLQMTLTERTLFNSQMTVT